MTKVSVFLEDETHDYLKRMALDRKTSLTKLIARICDQYRRDLDRRKKAA